MQIFIVVVLIIILLGILVFYIRNNQLDKLKKVKESFSQLPIEDIRDNIDRLANLKLSGNTFKIFESNETRLKQLQQNEYNTMRRDLIQVENNIKGLMLANGIVQLKNLSKKINTINIELDKIKDNLAKIESHRIDNEKQFQLLFDQYQDMRNSMLTHSLEYGDAFEYLESQLGKFEQEFNEFQKLNDEGNHEDAGLILSGIAAEGDKLNESRKILPDLIDQVENKTTQQIEEIAQVTSDLQSQGYGLVTNFEDEFVDKPKSHHAEIKELIKLGDFSRANLELESLRNEINDSYEALEKELKAKQNYKDTLRKVKREINTTLKENRKTKINLDYLSQGFVLNGFEGNRIDAFKEQIETINKQVESKKSQTEKPNIIYSQEYAQMEGFLAALEKIQAAQTEINDSVANLPVTTEILKDNANGFDLELKQQLRKIDAVHLPKIPQEYLEDRQEIVEAIRETKKQLFLSKVNLPVVNEQINLTKQKLRDFREFTDKLIDDAKMCEMLLQYSNRYISNNESVASANNISRNQYRQGEYYKALQTIEEALNEVDSEIVPMIISEMK